MHLLPDGVAIVHHGHIAGDDCRDAGLLGGIDNLVHQRDVLVVDDGVDRQIGLYTMTVALAGYVAQVVDGKRAGRMGAHVQLLDAEIHRVGSRLNGRRQTLARPHGRHHLKILYCLFHHYQSIIPQAKEYHIFIRTPFQATNLRKICETHLIMRPNLCRFGIKYYLRNEITGNKCK